MTQQYDPVQYIDPRGQHINIGDLVVVTTYGRGNPINGSFRFGIAESFSPGNPKWNNYDKCIFVRCLTFNTIDQTFGNNNGSWIHQHNRRVFKVTGDKLDIISGLVTQLATMMKGKDNG